MAKPINSSEDLAAAVELDDIQFYELRGRLRAAFNDEATEEPGVQKVRYQAHLDESRLAFRFRMTVYGTDGRYTADCAVIFSLEEPIGSVASEIMNQFIKDEAFPVLYPFLRESLFDIARRVGVEVPLLGILPSDKVDLELTLHEIDDDED